MGRNNHQSSPAALSIDVEDWFHSANLDRVVTRDTWDQCELRVERNTRRMMEILAEHEALGTFFVLGWVAERCPGLIRAIADAGHEVASHGYNHQLVYSLSPAEFREDVRRSKQLIEDLTGAAVRGYRAPCFSITDWAIPILEELGFDYDSSAMPTVGHDRYGHLEGMDARRPISLVGDHFHEVCISCLQLGSRGIPWGGGGYFRLMPYTLWRMGAEAILRSGAPYIFYIHPWEIDPGQPQISGIKASNAFRQRVNLHRCEERFKALVGAFDWTRICDLVDQQSPLPAPETAWRDAVAGVSVD